MVGDDGTYLEWDGSKFAGSFGLSNASTLAAVEVSSGGDRYVIGANGYRALLVRNSGAWLELPTPLQESEVTREICTTGSEVWVATSRNRLLSFRNNQWTQHLDGSGEFISDIACAPTGDVWVSGVDDVRHWNGNGWTSACGQTCSPGCQSLLGLWLDENHNPWLIGAGDACALRWGSTNSFEGTGMPDELSGEEWQLVAGSSSNDVWMMSDAQVVARWDGADWVTDLESPVARAMSLAFQSRTKGMAVFGSSEILEWDGNGWRSLRTGPLDSFRDVSVAENGTAWAIAGGSVLFRRTSDGWKAVATGELNELNSLWLANGSDGWAVGNGGLLLRWNGSSWMKASSPTSQNLKRVRGVHSNDIWMVGDADAFHWDGNSWTRVDLGGQGLVMDVSASESGRACVLRENSVSCWNGATWASKSIPGAKRVHITDAGVVFVFSWQSSAHHVVRWNPETGESETAQSELNFTSGMGLWGRGEEFWATTFSRTIHRASDGTISAWNFGGEAIDARNGTMVIAGRSGSVLVRED